jgi:hypothetical protein
LNVTGAFTCQTGLNTVVIELDALDAGLVPEAFVAVTVNVYAVFPAKP